VPEAYARFGRITRVPYHLVNARNSETRSTSAYVLLARTGNDREGNQHEAEEPLLPPPVSVGGQDDTGSAIVAPAVNSSCSQHEAATPRASGDGLTRSASNSASPELQPSVGSTQLRSPERYQILDAESWR
jgi:hypothetical protein